MRPSTSSSVRFSCSRGIGRNSNLKFQNSNLNPRWGVIESTRGMKPAILFFVKHPTPGKVKTRLAACVGNEEAGMIYRRLVEEICALLPRDAQVFVVFDPPE